MVNTKTQLTITVDAKTFAKIQVMLDEHMTPTSKYFNRLMMQDFQRRNQQRTLENFKGV